MVFFKERKVKKLIQEGERYADNKNFRQAEQCFTEALALRKANPVALVLRGEARYLHAMILEIAGIPDREQKQKILLQGAIDDLLNAGNNPLLLNEDRYSADYLRAGCLEMLGQENEALALYKRVGFLSDIDMRRFLPPDISSAVNKEIEALSKKLKCED